MNYIGFALWSAAAGALIPVIAALNARLGRAIGAPSYAAMVLFAVAFEQASANNIAATDRLSMGWVEAQPAGSHDAFQAYSREDQK